MLYSSVMVNQLPSSTTDFIPIKSVENVVTAYNNRPNPFQKSVVVKRVTDAHISNHKMIINMCVGDRNPTGLPHQEGIERRVPCPRPKTSPARRPASTSPTSSTRTWRASASTTSRRTSAAARSAGGCCWRRTRRRARHHRMTFDQHAHTLGPRPGVFAFYTPLYCLANPLLGSSIKVHLITYSYTPLKRH
jgi:hypothetical protein